MLAVFCYVYEAPFYYKFAEPFESLFALPETRYKFRNLAFILGFAGILIFGLSIVLPSKQK